MMNLLRQLQLMLRERLRLLLPHLANHPAYRKESLTLTSPSETAKILLEGNVRGGVFSYLLQ